MADFNDSKPHTIRAGGFSARRIISAFAKAVRSFVWLGAEPFPDKKENRRRAAVSERFPVITGWRADIPFFRNSIVQEARTARGRRVMSCAPLERNHRRERPWVGLEHITWRGVSARARNRAIGARCRCTFRLPVLFDRGAHQAQPRP